MAAPRMPLLLRTPPYSWRVLLTCRYYHAAVWNECCVRHPAKDSRFLYGNSAQVHGLYLSRRPINQLQLNSSNAWQHSVIPAKWSSSDSQGGNGGKGGGRHESSDGGKQGGFLRNFIANLRRGLEQNKDMQESLQGFHEERTKMEQSYVLQTARQKLTDAKDRAIAYSVRGVELVRESWNKSREISSKLYKEASETELAKKGHTIGSQIAKSAQETAEKVSEHAEELGKTDVAKTISKGATTVKEELLDDIIKESGPYKPPDKIQMRAEMSSGTSSAEHGTESAIEPNEDAKELVTTKQSKWKQQWQRLRENNPISNAFYNLKMKYDESDNLVIRASRVVTDRVGDAFSGVMTQSDMAEALTEILKIDPSFSKENFVQQCQFEIIPIILEAFLRGDTDVLKDWCHEAAFNVLSTIIKQRAEPGVKVDCKVLEVRDVDIVMAKLMDQGPVLVLTFQAQQLTVRRSGKEEEPDDEQLENIYYVWALCRDQTVYDPKTAWRILEFGIQAAGKLLV